MEKAVKKLDRRVVKTRRAIREAFRRKLEQGPLKAITVSGLASEADIDRKTFYLHFSSIDDLVDTEVRELLEHLVAAALRSSGQPGDVIDLRRVLLAFRDLTEEDPVIYERLLNSVPMEAIIDMVQPVIFEELHGSEARRPRARAGGRVPGPLLPGWRVLGVSALVQVRPGHPAGAADSHGGAAGGRRAGVQARCAPLRKAALPRALPTANIWLCAQSAPVYPESGERAGFTIPTPT